jgi:hypothetical protein
VESEKVDLTEVESRMVATRGRDDRGEKGMGTGCSMGTKL